MSEEEDLFLKEWEVKRRNWRWGKFIRKTTSNITFPIILITDLMNFFVIGDVKFGFFSFSHLWEIIKLLILFSLLITLPYGLFYWYSNELKFQKLSRKSEMERKKSIKRF